MTPQADHFDFIHKRMQELAGERRSDVPGTIERPSQQKIVNQRILTQIEGIRRRLPGENPSS
jgi:hypothetical protein